jgi:hypothetical protein
MLQLQAYAPIPAALQLLSCWPVQLVSSFLTAVLLDNSACVLKVN